MNEINKAEWLQTNLKWLHLTGVLSKQKYLVQVSFDTKNLIKALFNIKNIIKSLKNLFKA